MAITQIIATLPAVLNDSETFYEDIAVRNNSLVTVSFPSINTWATQANALAVEVNAKALQVASQAVDGGYSQNYINDNFFSQNYINDNFIGVNNVQTIAGIKTFSSNPLSTATQSTNSNALTKYSAVVKNTGDETIGGVKTFSSTIVGSISGNAGSATTLTGLTATVAELNFSDGVTSNIQTQLNGKLGIADIGTGTIGSYALLAHATTATTISEGGTYAGSSLRYAGVATNALNSAEANTYLTAVGTPSGTWRAMGAITGYSTYEGATLFLRIS